MTRYILASIVSGMLFVVMDGLINANPLAEVIYEAYKPILRTSVNGIAGIVIDLAYGFIMAAIFLVLYSSLPGQKGLAKGVGFGFMVWFFRVIMNAATGWMIFNIPATVHMYSIVTGFGEMLVIGGVYGLTLRSLRTG